ncbi:DUF3299 domain-containing protein [uncultured Nisaea sp.]|uniref:DUF3299 domain-containing protein n=1 Tax=uncultured Nisaea sp. TaxID=538215 RepID=UPI0030ED9D5A|tara:strand:+ start:1517 stop:2038 length:522 start_codon:yes stop_codon:yes gene_type:complete
MKDFTFNRRTALRMTAATAMTFLMRAYPAGASGKPRDILWEDLIPAASAPQPADKSTSLFDNSGPPPEQSMVGNDVVRELAGTRIRIPGYIIPLDYNGEGVNELILVPYVGACIHVPPPPPNQLILVRIAQSYNPREMFEPVYVSGVLGILEEQTDLAEVGYSLEADAITPYE